MALDLYAYLTSFPLQSPPPYSSRTLPIMTTRILLAVLCISLLHACDSQSPLEELTDEIEQLDDDNREDDNNNNDDDNDNPDDSSFESEMTTAINQARSAGRNCGSEYFPAVPPLSLDEQLTAAARTHTQDMANNDYLGHEGTDGSLPWDRVQEAGYQASTSGENVAAGYRTVEAVMEGWLGSDGHCANIMRPSYQDVGVARIEAPNTQYGVYWTQVFAAPR